MSITVTPEFIASLKAMVLEAVEKGEPPGGLGDDEPLFGPDSRLDLDSLDALQVSMTIQQRFGVRMPDSKETRRALTSIVHLAEHLAQAGKA
ncbi:acyl carrier protein [Variovorax sp. YR750]|nr:MULTISPECIES: phosphopantetheine-binding protein [Variovorax]SEL69556.1 acyl carrier protein [Variovorax sp. YR750]